MESKTYSNTTTMKNLTKIFTGLILFMLISGCSEEEHTFSYVVSGTSGSYSVTFQNKGNDTQQSDPVHDGWKYSWEQKGERWLYISAQNNKGSGSVTVSIVRDGSVLESNTSHGAYVIATVSGDF